ncbi:hypothetical protein K3495_g7965 [Podosphaera aphanis]|nr:hypothetical protein K3495_g7965 [Podosphaera aphanis]
MNQSRLTNVQRLEICRQKSLNPALKNKDLSAWVQQQYGLTVSLVTIGNILKRKQELEEMTPTSLSAKRPRISQHPQLDEALLFWVLQYESRRVAVTGSLIKAIGTVVSLLDLSKEKDLDFFKRLRRIQHEIRCSTNPNYTRHMANLKKIY